VQRIPRRELLAVAGWVILGGVLWNGIYDLVLGQGLREYLFRSALYDAGRGPLMPVSAVVDPYITDALWISTFWASLVTLAGLLTIRTLRARTPEETRR
jgi:hypothetical protein